MADDKLAAKLDKIKATMQKWYKELDDYKIWCKENDGIVDANEQAAIDRRTNDMMAISMRIAEIERKKGIAKPVEAPPKLAGEVEEIKNGLEEIKTMLNNY